MHGRVLYALAACYGGFIAVIYNIYGNTARAIAAGRVVRHDGDLVRVLSAAAAHMVVAEGRRRLALLEYPALLCTAEGGSLDTRLVRVRVRVRARVRVASAHGVGHAWLG